MAGDLRPAIHFFAETGPINDPNGLVHLDGEYHLFHQHNLDGLLHWGHAVSSDLVHWERLPTALHPDQHGHIYSGSAVVDRTNCSGLGSEAAPALLAFFTYHSVADDTESQAVAWSTDRGRTWTKLAANPVIANPGLADFRDPKVLWHEASQGWVMVLAAGDHVLFYRSGDLLHWDHAGSWGSTDGAHADVWECPDLFEIGIEGGSETRWVLSVSVADGAPAGGSGMQYFVGGFDGFTFSNDNPPDTVLWHGWGADSYAGVTWEGVPEADGRRLMISWADNVRYRWDIPTSPWLGQLTVVHELTLRRTPEGIRLRHTPARELESLRGGASEWPTGVVDGTGEVWAAPAGAYEVLVAFDADAATAEEYGVDVHVGPDEWVRIGFDRLREAAFVDRSRTATSPHPDFARRHEAPAASAADRSELRILVDRSLVEVFTGGGEHLVDLVLPSAGSRGFRPFAVAGTAPVTRLTTFPLASVGPGPGGPSGR